MQDYKPFLKPCEKHNPKKLAFICTHPSCNDRLLCQGCLRNHNIQHENSYVPIMEALTLDPDADFQQTKKKLEEIQFNIQKHISLINDFFERLEKKIIQEIAEVRDIYLSAFTSVDKLKEYEDGKEMFEKLRNEISNSDDNYTEFRNEFAEAYSRFSQFKVNFPSLGITLPFSFSDEKYLSKLDFKNWVQIKLGPIQTSLTNMVWTSYSNLLKISENLKILTPKSTAFSNYIGALASDPIIEEVTVWSGRMNNDTGSFLGLMPKSKISGVDSINHIPCYYIAFNGYLNNMQLKGNQKSVLGKKIDFRVDLRNQAIEVYVDEELYGEGKLNKDEYYVMGFFCPGMQHPSIELL